MGDRRQVGTVPFEEWQRSVPRAIVADPLWRMEVYRLSLYAADIGWSDVTALTRDRRTLALSTQLYRSLGSISANIAEGYSRGSDRDRVRFFEYSLGSARESRDWYYKARHVLDHDVIHHRVDLMSQIIRSLLVIIPAQRGRAVHEDRAPYDADDL